MNHVFVDQGKSTKSVVGLYENKAASVKIIKPTPIEIKRKILDLRY